MDLLIHLSRLGVREILSSRLAEGHVFLQAPHVCGMVEYQPLLQVSGATQILAPHITKYKVVRFAPFQSTGTVKIQKNKVYIQFPFLRFLILNSLIWYFWTIKVKQHIIKKLLYPAIVGI